MAKRQPSSDLRGVILPEPNILEAAYTATSQAGPRAGAVVPDQTTGLSLHGSGEIDATSESSTGTEIELATARGGGVGDATIRWRFAGDTYRSWDAPVALDARVGVRVDDVRCLLWARVVTPHDRVEPGRPRDDGHG